MLQDIYDQVKGFLAKVKPQPLTVEVEGEHYKVVPQQYGLQVGDHIRKPGPTAKPTLTLQTLTGFVDAYNAKIDSFPGAGAAAHVIDHSMVALRSILADDFGRRHDFVLAVCREDNPFPFNQFQIPEAFLINLQAGFLPTDDVIALQKFASALSSETSVSVQDDGFSQAVTVKAGGVTRSEIKLPPRIKLFAYRTFREIDPVESEFIVRLKGNPGSIPQIALMEVDAGRWKLDSVTLVAQWLKDKLPAGTVVIA